jgi:Tol biopolymer transport system component
LVTAQPARAVQAQSVPDRGLLNSPPTHANTASGVPVRESEAAPGTTLTQPRVPAAVPIRAAVLAGPVLSATTVGADVFSPSFIEQGRALVFHAGRDRAPLMRLSFGSGGQPAVATVLQDGAANYHAVPSPDGEWFAYDSNRAGTRAVYIVRRNGHDRRKVSGEGYAAVPRWSPDGRRLAFLKAEPQRPRVWNVWMADLDTGSLTRVSRHRVGQAWGASWFPDGNRLAYSVEDRLIVADRQLGTARSLASPIPGRLVRTPAVSPDGKWVVFQVHRDGAWLFEVATGKMKRVLTDPTAEEFAWSPDSRRVVYHTRRNGAWSLWQFALDPAA